MSSWHWAAATQSAPPNTRSEGTAYVDAFRPGQELPPIVVFKN